MNRANFSCLFIFLAFPLGVMAQQPTDSVQTRQLDEVKVTAKTQVETPVASLFLPTKLQKKHSTNGFQLLDYSKSPNLKYPSWTMPFPLKEEANWLSVSMGEKPRWKR